MRPTGEQIREALLHPDDGVRRLAFGYLTDPPATDPVVTAAVMAAVARHGPKDFLSGLGQFARLPHTDASLGWVLETLATHPVPADADDREEVSRYDGVRVSLVNTLLECPADLFARHADAVFALPLTPAERASLELRRELDALDADALWERLRVVSEELTAAAEPWGSPQQRVAEQLTRAAAARPGLAPRVMGRVNGLGGEFHFLDVFAIRLAARMKLAEAVGPLLDFMADCDSGWHDDLEPALRELASGECVRLFRERWKGANSDFRYTAACVLGAVHTDESVTACLELAAELNPYARQAVSHRLLESAVLNLHPAAVEPTRRFLLKAPHTFDSRLMYEQDLRGSLLDACTLTGKRFPEYDRWRKQEADERAAAQRRAAGLDPPLPLPRFAPPDPAPPERPAPHRDTVVGTATAGRNDPCPCGSGKKYKKCCGR